jgi:transposase-like protein
LQGKELQVRRKKQVNKYPTAFRKMALERLKSCRSATELASELGIHRTQLYKWRDQMEPGEDGPGPAANSRERELRKEIRELKRVLGEKALEVDFFKGCAPQKLNPPLCDLLLQPILMVQPTENRRRHDAMIGG